MARYQKPIFINNPEKLVSEETVAQFFKTLTEGEVDKVRAFALANRNKYNIINRQRQSATGETPYHTVLRLDDSIADETTKLEMVKYLEVMGAPMDLPDANSQWPIHLAVATQSYKIVKFFVEKGVNIERADASNNTPLHYAVTGKPTDCPTDVSIGRIDDNRVIAEQAYADIKKDMENTIKGYMNYIISFVGDRFEGSELYDGIEADYEDFLVSGGKNKFQAIASEINNIRVQSKSEYLNHIFAEISQIARKDIPGHDDEENSESEGEPSATSSESSTTGETPGGPSVASSGVFAAPIIPEFKDKTEWLIKENPDISYEITETAEDFIEPIIKSIDQPIDYDEDTLLYRYIMMLLAFNNYYEKVAISDRIKLDSKILEEALNKEVIIEREEDLLQVKEAINDPQYKDKLEDLDFSNPIAIKTIFKLLEDLTKYKSLLKTSKNSSDPTDQTALNEFRINLDVKPQILDKEFSQWQAIIDAIEDFGLKMAMLEVYEAVRSEVLDANPFFLDLCNIVALLFPGISSRNVNLGENDIIKWYESQIGKFYDAEVARIWAEALGKTSDEFAGTSLEELNVDIRKIKTILMMSPFNHPKNDEIDWGVFDAFYDSVYKIITDYRNDILFQYFEAWKDLEGPLFKNEQNHSLLGIVANIIGEVNTQDPTESLITFPITNYPYVTMQFIVPRLLLRSIRLAHASDRIKSVAERMKSVDAEFYGTYAEKITGVVKVLDKRANFLKSICNYFVTDIRDTYGSLFSGDFPSVPDEISNYEIGQLTYMGNENIPLTIAQVLRNYRLQYILDNKADGSYTLKDTKAISGKLFERKENLDEHFPDLGTSVGRFDLTGVTIGISVMGRPYTPKKYNEPQPKRSAPSRKDNTKRSSKKRQPQGKKSAFLQEGGEENDPLNFIFTNVVNSVSENTFDQLNDLVKDNVVALAAESVLQENVNLVNDAVIVNKVLQVYDEENVVDVSDILKMTEIFPRLPKATMVPDYLLKDLKIDDITPIEIYDANVSSMGDAYRRCLKYDSRIVTLVFTPRNAIWRNSDGDTPLHLAVGSQNYEATEKLIDLACYVHNGWKNLRGFTPIELADDSVESIVKMTYGIQVKDSLGFIVDHLNPQLFNELKSPNSNYANTVFAKALDVIPAILITYNKKTLDRHVSDANLTKLYKKGGMNFSESQKSYVSLITYTPEKDEEAKFVSYNASLRRRGEPTTSFVASNVTTSNQYSGSKVGVITTERMNEPMKDALYMIIHQVLHLYKQDIKTVTSFFKDLVDQIERKNTLIINDYARDIIENVMKDTFVKDATEFITDQFSQYYQNGDDIKAKIYNATYNEKGLTEHLQDYLHNRLIGTEVNTAEIADFVPDIMRAAGIWTEETELPFQRLKDEIILFVINSFDIMIKYAKAAIYSYERFILSTYQKLQIRQLVGEKC